MKESDLLSNLLLKLRKINSTWWYKIPDPTRCPGCGLIGIASRRPFDVVGMVNGVPVALEMKRSAGIPLEPHQLAQLKMVTMAGGVGIKVEKNKFYLVNPDGTLELISNSVEGLINYLKV